MALVALASILLAGCAPNNIATATCRDEMLATGDPWSCVVSGEHVSQASSIEFDTESRNQVAKVKMAFNVTRGTLRIGYRDLGGDQRLTVTPAAPAAVEMQTRLHRENRSFTLYFEPLGGNVEGLSGTVDYLTP